MSVVVYSPDTVKQFDPESALSIKTPKITDDLEAKGKAIYKNNTAMRDMMTVLEHPEFASFINKYFNNASDTQAMLMFMKTYQAIPNNNPFEKIAIVNDAIQSNQARAKLTNDFINWHTAHTAHNAHNAHNAHTILNDSAEDDHNTHTTLNIRDVEDDSENKNVHNTLNTHTTHDNVNVNTTFQDFDPYTDQTCIYQDQKYTYQIKRFLNRQYEKINNKPIKILAS